MLEILGCKLVGGGACPEQYDISFNGKQLGYFRLRWSGIGVSYPDYGGELVYSRDYGGNDGYCGELADEDRERILTEVVQTLLDKLTEGLKPGCIPEDEGI